MRETHILYLLQANVRLIEAEGGPGMLHLADLIRTALARTGFNVPPRDYDNPKAHHGRDQRMYATSYSQYFAPTLQPC